ncbi:MAG: type VI secretion system protein TssA, partial [Bilophila sp.]
VLAWHPVAEPETLAVTGSALPTVVSVSSREQAYASLAALADYLMRTEPHSPAPWLVKRAVAWGNMSLTELLEELLGQGENLDSIRKLLGIPKENSEK